MTQPYQIVPSAYRHDPWRRHCASRRTRSFPSGPDFAAPSFHPTTNPSPALPPTAHTAVMFPSSYLPTLKATADVQLQTAFSECNWASVARLADKRARSLKDPYYEVRAAARRLSARAVDW